MVQLQVLNAIINNQDSSILLLNNLNGEYFSDYLNEYEFIKRHLAEYGKVPDQISFLDKFPNFEVIEVNEPTNYLLSELYNDRNTRFLARTFNSIRKLLNECKTQEAMTLYTNASNELVFS